MSRRTVSRRAVVVAVVVLVATVVPAVVGAGSETPFVGASGADAASRTFGSSPRDDVLYWAERKRCGDLSRDALAAMMLTPTFTETGATGANAPGPMTLSRWDTQAALYAFGTKGLADKAFFHPGIGMWQFDSAGFWPLTAATAINSYTSAEQAASVMASRYCASSQTDPVKKRQSAWAPWYYCTSGTLCEGVYQSVLSSGVLDVNTTSISSLGGMEQRTCEVTGIGHVSCGFVDPAKAQGYAAWAIPNFGPAPVTAPFYVFEANGREYRYWLKQDTGYAQTIRADKPVTANARTSLSWSYSDTLCDRTGGRGTCTPAGWSSPAAIGMSTLGAPALGRNKDGRLEVFVVASTGRLWHRWQLVPNGGWSAWQDLGGSLAPDATPALGTSPDGRQEVFIRSSTGSLHHIFQTVPNGGWSAWGDRGGATTSKHLAVGTNADGRLEVFGRGSSGDLVHWWQLWPNGMWSAGGSLGGSMAIATDPGVGTTTDGRQKVVIIDSGGLIRSSTQYGPNGMWAPFDVMGGPFPSTASPIVGRNADGRLEVFAVGPFALLVNSWQTAPGAGGFAPFGAVTGYFANTPSVVLDKAGKQSVFAQSWFGGTVTQVRQNVPNGGWGAPATVAGATGRRIAAATNADGRLEVVYVDASGQLVTSWQVAAAG
ncbi:MAG: hypothetical protein KDB36_08410 [Acidimicrobiales bacterium]|nr:hypothetical protein [Acidimicrobiales bacterium]